MTADILRETGMQILVLAYFTALLFLAVFCETYLLYLQVFEDESDEDLR
jgi:hypothetical protein